MQLKHSNGFRGMLLGVVVGVALQLIGYLIARDDRSDFGLVMFIVVPFVSGFAVAAVTSAVVAGRGRIIACCLAGCIITFTILLFTGWEGIICCFMAAPLVGIGLLLGALLGCQVRRRFIEKASNPRTLGIISVLLCPLFIAGANRIEQPFRTIQEREVFASEILLPVLSERAWELVAAMDRLDGPRPFLLRAGLPVPNRCELRSSSVGGERVCYFDQGAIEQEVTTWQHPSKMAFRVTGNTLPGRRWLTFIDADYEFASVDGGTRVVRHTTIGTRLYPRW